MCGHWKWRLRKSRSAIQSELIAKLEKQNQKLRLVAQEHEILERFIAQLNELCVKNGCQLCGIRKIVPENEPPFYVGFVITAPVDVDPRSCAFDIIGYKSTNPTSLSKVYYAHVCQVMEPVPYNGRSRLRLTDHKTTAEARGNGIGSAGISIIKELAFQLHCSEIYGRREPDTPEDLEKLRRFYARHEFALDEDNGMITFDMKGYVPPYRKKATQEAQCPEEHHEL